MSLGPKPSLSDISTSSMANRYQHENISGDQSRTSFFATEFARISHGLSAGDHTADVARKEFHPDWIREASERKGTREVGLGVISDAVSFSSSKFAYSQVIEGQSSGPNLRSGKCYIPCLW
jgi:hypothetical protein